MITKVSKWGNSLGIRIPKATVDMLNLSDGIEVELSTENGELTIKPIRPKYTLQQLCDGMTREAVLDQKEEIPPVGKEQYWSDHE